MRLGRSQRNHRKLHRWTSIKEGPGSGRRGHVLWGAGPSFMGFMLMEPHHLDMSCMFWLGICIMSGEDHIPELVFLYPHSGKKCHFPTWRSYWKASFIVVQVWQCIVISYARSNLSCGPPPSLSLWVSSLHSFISSVWNICYVHL